MSEWPITIDLVKETAAALRPVLAPTPARRYPKLERAVGHDIELWIKHENYQPTGSFKVRNGLAALSALDSDSRKAGVVAATRGNHGQGVAFAARSLGIPVTICVPENNSPSKNEAMRDLGAEVIERGADYDDSVELAMSLVEERQLTLIHSTNNPHVIAGAATITLEFLSQVPDLDCLLVTVGGGSQAVGAMTVTRALSPDTEVYGVQARGASAIHDAWHYGNREIKKSPETFADGLATRSTYDMTFPALQAGLTDFVLVDELEMAAAVRDYLFEVHTLAEGAGAASLAGLRKTAPRMSGQRVGLILSGANIDENVLRWCLDAPVPEGTPTPEDNDEPVDQQ